MRKIVLAVAATMLMATSVNADDPKTEQTMPEQCISYCSDVCQGHNDGWQGEEAFCVCLSSCLAGEHNDCGKADSGAGD